ncbi:MAG TPA: alpha/beta hydrolase domain-containing protein [Acidimicrobiales bacterium]
MRNHRVRPGRAAALATVLAAGLLAAPAGPAGGQTPPTAAAPPAGVATPTVTGPVDGAPFSVSRPVDLAAAGYRQDEFFLSGTAQAYLDDGPWGDDGRWNARPNPDATAPYTTRTIVRRPASKADFNGTVVVEWLNVSAGFDAEPDWVWENEELLRSGYAYVGVSAQAVGVNFLRGIPRYAGLSHPGDAFSYDMFSQAAKAVEAPAAGGPQPLGDLTRRVRRLLADGESQSAGRMVTYVNAVQPLTGSFDGFLIHSTGGGANLSQPSPAGSPVTPTVPAVRPLQVVRTDQDAPVLVVNTETDIVRAGSASAIHGQPDADRFRVWELTGTSHIDLDQVGNFDCGGAPVNDAPQRWALRAAVHTLDRWVRRPSLGAPKGPRISVTAGALDRDPATGLVVGGIRLPDVAVPDRTLTGVRPSPPANLFCVLDGAHDPWNGDADPWDGDPALDPSPTPEPVPAALYASKQDYAFRYVLSGLQLNMQGFLLAGDFDELLISAQARAEALPGVS